MESKVLDDDASSTFSRNSLSDYFNNKQATLDAAERHHCASRVTNLQDIDRCALPPSACCECCSFPVDAPLFPLAALDSLSALGSAVPLYFHLSRHIALMLLIVTVLAAIPDTIIFLSVGTYSKLPITRFSVMNHRHAFSPYPMLLNLFAIIVICFVYNYTTLRMKGLMKNFEEDSITPSKFAVLVKNLGRDWNRDDLKRHIEENMKAKGKSVKVVDINICYDTSEFDQVIKDIKQIRANEKKFHKQQKKPPTIFRRAFNAVLRIFTTKGRPITQEQIKAELGRLETQYIRIMNQEWKKTGVAVVLLETNFQAKAFIETWKRGILRRSLGCCFPDSKELLFNGRRIYVKKAPEPEDVAWGNLKYSRGKRLLMQILAIAVVIGVLCINFCFLMLIAALKADVKMEKLSKTDHDSDSTSLISFSAAILTLVLNYGIKIVSKKLSKIEHHHSFTTENLFVSWKLIIFVSINMLLLSLLINVIFVAAEFADGLAPDIFWTVANLAFAMPFANCVMPAWCVVKRVFCRRRLRKHPPSSSQRSLNKHFELPDPEISQWYVTLICNFLLALAYTGFLPILAPMMLIGTVLQYWINKFLLLRHSRRPIPMNHRLPRIMMQFVKPAIILYAIGMLACSITPGDFATSGTAFLIALIFWSIPVSCCKCCFRKYLPKLKAPSEVRYQEAAKNFFVVSNSQLYESSNPVTSLQMLPDKSPEALQKYMLEQVHKQAVPASQQFPQSRRQSLVADDAPPRPITAGYTQIQD